MAKPASKTGGGRRCESLARDGRPCRGRAGPDGLCSFHSPRTAALLRDGRRLGGKLRTAALQGAIVSAGQAKPPEWWALETREDLRSALRDVARGTLARRIDPRTANSVALVVQGLVAEARDAEQKSAFWTKLSRQLEDLEIELEGLVDSLAPRRSHSHLERAAEGALRLAGLDDGGRAALRRDLERVRDLAREALRSVQRG